MNILITNDDGISSPGIYALAKEFINEGNVIISAPDRQRSACSHSITMHEAISVSKYSFFDLNCTAYAVSGTPADCVKLAYDKLFDKKIDVVISGINDGGNLGTDVLYSGTVSAAIEGAILNIPSFAVSLVTNGNEPDFNTAAKYAHDIYIKFISNNFVNGITLNINIPSCKKQHIKGVLPTCLGNRRYINNYEEKKDTAGNTNYWLAGDLLKTDNGSTTDIFAVENNYVSVTPMHFELTKFDYLEVIKNWYVNV